MATGDHDGIDLSGHADLASVILGGLHLLLPHHRLLSHHLLSRVYQLIITNSSLVDIWKGRLVLILLLGGLGLLPPLHLLLLLLHLVALHPCIWHVSVALSLEISMRIGRLNKVGFQGVHVTWVLQVVDNQLGIFLMDALIVEEILHFNKVHTHFDHLLHKSFLALAKEVDLLLISAKTTLLGKLLLDLSLSFFSRWHRHNIALLEEVHQLPWYLL